MMNSDDAHADAETCMGIVQSSPPLTLHYLAEGGANVIYSVAPATSDPGISVHDHCCVLRMRKDLPTTRPCVENVTAIHEKIVPLFTDDHDHTLMPKVLFRLDAGILQQARSILDGLDGQVSGEANESATGTNGAAVSSTKRRISHPSLDEEPHAILMPNLRHGEHALFREFKPKWLRQSPNAPRDARRCRTCAANAFKRAQGDKKGKGDSGFCPLDLLSSDRSVIREILRKIGLAHGNSSDNPGEEDEELVEAFIQKVQPVLHHLAELQSQHDTKGIDDASNPEGRDYAVAMALRDCSVFMVLDKSAAANAARGKLSLTQVKLADLDLKISSPDNLEKWAKMEYDLVASGAYSNASVPGSACALERSRVSV